ncbi:MAG: hypothetical protein HFG34_10075 [Eubacterium sp.]|nr:hypothetical protein [Eubacterium sp.]
MKTKKRFIALLLSLAMIISIFVADGEILADTKAANDSITVTLRVEDSSKTLVPPTRITLDKDTVATINDTFNASVETPVLETAHVTAAHALAKYISDQSKTPASDLTFAYGNPASILGQDTLDASYFWSFRVNNASPVAEDGFTQYNFTSCPVQDGDSIVVFRQYYNATTSESSSYSYFDKESYETGVNEKVSVTLKKESFDENWNTVTIPMSDQNIVIAMDNTAAPGPVPAIAWMATTDKNGTAELSFNKAGTYILLSSSMNADGTPATSRAYAKVTVKTTQPPASTTPAPPASAVTPPPTIPQHHSCVIKKPVVPRKIKAKVKKKKVTISWKKTDVIDIDGFEVFYSKKNKKNFKKLSVTKKTKVTKKFKKGKYFVKCRCYRLQNGNKIYSNYSKIISFKVK